jgi:hypothetical protein
MCLSSGTSNLSEILAKIARNNGIFENQRGGFFEFVKKIIAQITNSEMGQTIYEIESIDPAKGKIVCEKISFANFYSQLENRIAILASFSSNGNPAKKLEDMDEQSLIELLKRNIKEVQNFHKTLDNFDNYFKKLTEKSSHYKFKGIKPELSALKNTLTKANEKLQDYIIGKEEEEQFKQLGINN